MSQGAPLLAVWIIPRIMTAVATVLLFAFVAAAQEDKFGAIAFSQPDGICGASYDYSTREGAEGGAMRECKEKGGTACKIITSFRNNCAALARTEEGGYGWGRRSTKEEAQGAAMTKCDEQGAGCRVICSVCSEEGYSPPPSIPVEPSEPVWIDSPPPRTCNCCRRVLLETWHVDPRTGRRVMVNRQEVQCSRMSRSRCRAIGGWCN